MTSITEWLAQQKKLLEALRIGGVSKSKDAAFIASVRTEHDRALKIIEKMREALEYYAKQVEPILEENYVSALALMHDIDHVERIQKLKLPAKEALAYFPDMDK